MPGILYLPSRTQPEERDECTVHPDFDAASG